MQGPHMIQILRKLDHPQLQEYLELTDQLDLLDNQLDHLGIEQDAFEADLKQGLFVTADSQQKLKQLSERTNDLYSKVRTVVQQLAKVRSTLINDHRIIECLVSINLKFKT